jgi:hypothetical protein
MISRPTGVILSVARLQEVRTGRLRIYPRDGGVILSVARLQEVRTSSNSSTFQVAAFFFGCPIHCECVQKAGKDVGFMLKLTMPG